MIEKETKLKNETDIAAYYFRGEYWAPEAIVARLTVNPGDGYHEERRKDDMADIERELNLLARISGINREDEQSYGSDEFPKVVHKSEMQGDEPLKGRDY